MIFTLNKNVLLLCFLRNRKEVEAGRSLEFEGSQDYCHTKNGRWQEEGRYRLSFCLIEGSVDWEIVDLQKTR